MKDVFKKRTENIRGYFTFCLKTDSFRCENTAEKQQTIKAGKSFILVVYSGTDLFSYFI